MTMDYFYCRMIDLDRLEVAIRHTVRSGMQELADSHGTTWDHTHQLIRMYLEHDELGAAYEQLTYIPELPDAVRSVDSIVTHARQAIRDQEIATQLPIVREELAAGGSRWQVRERIIGRLSCDYQWAQMLIYLALRHS